MTDILASPWIPAVVLLLFACAARWLSKSWLAPSAFALGMWSLYVIVPLLLAPTFRVSALSVWIIAVLLLSMSAGAALAEGPRAAKPLRVFSIIPTRRMFRLMLIFSGTGLAGAVYYAVASLRDAGTDPSLTAILLLGRSLYIAYESDPGHQQPLLVRALAIWVFSGAILAGMSYVLAKTRRERLLCFAPLVPALLFSLLNATRANTLMAIILGLSGYLSTRIATPSKTSLLISKRALLLGAVSVAIAISFFFAVQAVREHAEDSDLAVAIDWPQIKGAGLGYLADFSYWMGHPDDPSLHHLGLGAYTFSGIFDALGLHQRDVGIYTEFVMLDGEPNNIYTAFRGVIQDFSLPGAMGFFLVLGLALGRAYRKCSLGNYCWIPLLAAGYAFLVWSPLGSIFVYNGSLVAVLIGWAALRYQSRRNHQATKKAPEGLPRLEPFLYPGEVTH